MRSGAPEPTLQQQNKGAEIKIALNVLDSEGSGNRLCPKTTSQPLRGQELRHKTRHSSLIAKLTPPPNQEPKRPVRPYDAFKRIYFSMSQYKVTYIHRQNIKFP